MDTKREIKEVETKFIEPLDAEFLFDLERAKYYYEMYSEKYKHYFEMHCDGKLERHYVSPFLIKELRKEVKKWLKESN